MISKPPRRISSSINRFMDTNSCLFLLLQFLTSSMSSWISSDIQTSIALLVRRTRGILVSNNQYGMSCTTGGRNRRENREESNPSRAINTGKFAFTRPSREKVRNLLRSHCPGSGAILGQESSDFFAQDLIARWTQVDLIAHKKRLDRFAILPKHVGTNVDVFCLRLGLKKIAHQPIKFQDVLQKHQTRRTWLYRDERYRYGRGVSPEDGEQLFERLENFFRRRSAREIVVACVDHNSRRFSRDNESVGVSNAIAQSRTAKTTIQHGVSRKILLERFPKPDRGTAVKNDLAGRNGQLRQLCLEGGDF